jgi:endonuclease YncB( thermonuclease family)
MICAAQAAAARSEESLWPDKPKRVHKQDPSLERLPARPAEQPKVKLEDYPLKLDRTAPARVIDSISFIQMGKKYRLAGLDPVAVGKTCKRPDGQRWACGLRSRVALGQLLRGSKQVRCAQHGEDDGFVVVECLRGDKDIGATLAASGYALAPGGQGPYKEEEEAARLNKAGVWADEAAGE